MNYFGASPRGINRRHSRDLLIGNPETIEYFTFLDTRFRGYDEHGKPRGINPEYKLKKIYMNSKPKLFFVITS